MQQAAFIRKYGLYGLISAGVLLLASLLFGAALETILLALLLIVIASFSTFYFNYVSAPINLELVKFSTIIMAFHSGVWAALIVGISSTLIGKILIGRIDEKLPISIIAISTVAVLASVLSGGDIVVVGIVLVGLYNVVMFIVSMMLGGDLGWNLPYEASSFIFNLLLFTRIVPYFV